MILIIFIIIIFILFIPLPIRFQLNIVNNSLDFSIFKVFSIKLDNLTQYYHIKHLNKLKNKITIKKLHNIINKLNNFHYKPKVFIDFRFKYCLIDAARTAVFYSIFNIIFSYINYFMSLIYKIKYNSCKIDPVYNDNLYFSCKIKGILLISLAQIIIIILITFRIKIRLREVNP
ncbi:DUF2953 domain-containing protein [Clostridium sp. BJN0001]|uniref:DUF2953 domain-containing protein n=1 Tax=Clostridium sp. BJN0001 TaxID=2930219 RepID=UPI001FD05729|nr:DUF2953 domain-containing protein [Clostridium sp. BJN0001]